MGKKSVVVCGDLVWDIQIARVPIVSRGYYDPHPQTQLRNLAGGAWYLCEMIKEALSANGRINDVECLAPVEAKHEEVESEKCPRGIAKAVSIFKWYPVKEDKPAEAGAWRVAEFLGCQQPRWDTPAHGAIKDEPPRADVLAIDDLGLGFADHPECWPRSLAGEPPEAIVVKATPPFSGKLWEKLLEPQWAQRTSVIVGAAALRAVGADLSKGMSWDQIIDDLAVLFSAGGACFALRDCRRVIVSFGRGGAAVYSREPQSPASSAPTAALQFERLVFDPMHLEDTWSEQLPGISFGTTSALAAAMVCHELSGPKPSSHISVSRGLGAAREQHRVGSGGNHDHFDKPLKDVIFRHKSDAPPWKVFRSAFNRQLLDAPAFGSKDEPESILNDVVGPGRPFLIVAAEAIVREGREKHLASVPRLEIGKYFTVDRQEIENLNSVRQRIEHYRGMKDSRPLSIAVFGAPGSGKSFAIKQLAEKLFGKEQKALEFNLSQFRDVEDLHEAFHEVRDKSVQQQLPLVFWDEFDAEREGEKLGWLKEFLAPMQDALFVANGKPHPFGQCIFIFAGGTCPTFEKFDRSRDDDEHFRAVKGPDFVSRLRGFVNIKGPNPTSEVGDAVHVIRRALLLRSLIERHHPQAVNGASRKLKIHPGVLAAFLEVDEYRHGARSMEAIITLSALRANGQFGPSELPPREVIGLHVSEDFMKILRDKDKYRMTEEDIERLAELKHRRWLKKKRSEGYVDQANGNPNALVHEDCVDYGKLSEAKKDSNRMPASLAVLRLEGCQFRIMPAERAGKQKPAKVDKPSLERLAMSEHRRWMREKLMKGVAYASQRDDALLLHPDLRKFVNLPESEKQLDDEIIAAIEDFVKERKLVLVRAPEGANGKQKT